MARPKSKTELLKLSTENFEKLNSLVEGMSLSEQNHEFPKGTMNRNVRDVLAHIHHWHLMFLAWYEVGMSGQKPEMPAKGYSWKTTPELNNWIWKHYQQNNLNGVKKLLRESFQKVQKIIENHSSEELYEKKRYRWTGTTSLGSYLVSSTSSHYDWGLKLIKKARKMKAKPDK